MNKKGEGIAEMKRPDAEHILKNLIGWINPQMESVGHGNYIVTAIDPYDNRRKVFNPRSGFFRSGEDER